MKQIDIADMDQQQRQERLNFCKHLEQINHPNILKYSHVTQSNDKSIISFQLECAEGGNL